MKPYSLKYINTTASGDAESAHWRYCEAHHLPYIQITPVHSDFCNIFFDITQLSFHMGDEEISERLNTIYSAYVEFHCITSPLVDSFQSQPYCMNWVVYHEDAVRMAEQLFTYLHLHSIHSN